MKPPMSHTTYTEKGEKQCFPDDASPSGDYVMLCAAASLLPAVPLPSPVLELTGTQCVHRETGEQMCNKGTETAEDREIP